MVDTYDIIKVLLKTKKVNTDNNIFRLHYKFTVILLLLFSLLVTSKQYFGDPIDCDTGSKDKYIMDTYCWIYSTYTVRRHLHGEIGKTNVYPGIGPSQAYLSSDNTADIISHKYYQWVCIVLFIQAIFFYIPRYLWKIWEAGRLVMLVKDLGSPIVQSSWNQTYKEYLTNYIMDNSYIHNVYAIRYTICEILNILNVTGQIFLMDWFLAGQFTGFGIAIITFSLSGGLHESNPMSHVFPKLAKCMYPSFGPSGTIQNIDALCVLPLNVVNEKIYVILWIWFYFLAIISLLDIFYRIMVFASTTVRGYLLMGQVGHLNKKTAFDIVENISFGDWFMLTQIGKNVNPAIFHEVVQYLGQKTNPSSKIRKYNAFPSIHV